MTSSNALKCVVSSKSFAFAVPEAIASETDYEKGSPQQKIGDFSNV